MADEWCTSGGDGWGNNNQADTEDSWNQSAPADSGNDNQNWGSSNGYDNSNSGGAGYGGSSYGGGSSNDRGCFNCNQTGHMSRDCPEPRRGGGGGGGDRPCYNCQQTGHMSRDCPEPRKTGGGGGDDRPCYNCQQTGHMSRDCPEPRKAGGGGGGDDRGCFNCKQPGHLSRDCPEPRKNADGEEEKPRPPPYIPEEMPTDANKLYDECISSGINFERHQDVPVKVTGIGAPAPISAFTDCISDPQLLNIINHCGWKNPTPIQKHALPAVKAGRDLMGCAQTGSGKTAAFLLPMIQDLLKENADSLNGAPAQQPQCVVIAPTRELAIQIHREAYKCCWGSPLKSQIIYGGTQVSHQRAMLSGGTHILVATPGRLNDFVNRGWVSFERVKYLVLDEADRLIDDGFIPVVREVLSHETIKGRERQTLMFSATFPKKVQSLAAEFLRKEYLFLTVGIIGSANSDVKQEIVLVEKREKKSKLMDLLKDENEESNSRFIVFVETKATADYLANFISISHSKTTSIHGDRFQEQREQALRDFRLGKARILVATSVAARGLDIKGVSHVINYDMPKDIDEYVHRIGRTGRVGHTGLATSFYCSETDMSLASDLLSVLKSSNQEVPDWLEREATGGGSGFDFGSSDIRSTSDWTSNGDSGWNTNAGGAAAPSDWMNGSGNSAPMEGDAAPADSFTTTNDDDW